MKSNCIHGVSHNTIFLHRALSKITRTYQISEYLTAFVLLLWAKKWGSPTALKKQTSETLILAAMCRTKVN